MIANLVKDRHDYREGVERCFVFVCLFGGGGGGGGRF
jgi:hypothetical protein